MGVITPALIISGSEVCSLSADEKTTLIQASLVITALATLLEPSFQIPLAKLLRKTTTAKVNSATPQLRARS